MKRRGLSINIKMSVAFMLLIIIMSALFIMFLTLISQSVYRETEEKDLKELVTENLSHINGFDERGRLSISEGFVYELSGSYILVYSKERSIIAGQPPLGFSGNLDFEDGIMRIENMEGNSYFVLDVYYPIDWERGVWIRGISPFSSQQKIIRNLLKASVLSLPAFIIIAGLGSYFISRGAFKPLKQIINTAKNITEGKDLSGRIDLERGSSEFIDLSDTMDEMFERLEKSFERERQFTSNASHELRTPIAIIKGACDYSLKYDSYMDEWRESMEMIERQSNKMSDMVEGLLDITRLSQGKIKTNFEEVNLSDLLEEIALDQALIAKEKNIGIITDIKNKIFIKGEEILLIRMFSNLIDNAIKYGKEGGSIWINARLEKEEAIVEIKDNGIGMDNNQIERIFERFYRLDESRDDSNRGAGLGLAMVEEIVKLHGGTINVSSTPGFGSVFSVKLKIFKKF